MQEVSTNGTLYVKKNIKRCTGKLAIVKGQFLSSLSNLFRVIAFVD